MNSRIYSKEVFDKAVNDYLGKKYCPHCYSDVTSTKLSYSYINSSTAIRNNKRCQSCRRVFTETEILNKQEVRNKKIDEVLEK